MVTERHFKSKIRVNTKNGKKYYSVRVPPDVVKRMSLKKGTEIDLIAKSKEGLF